MYRVLCSSKMDEQEVVLTVATPDDEPAPVLMTTGAATGALANPLKQLKESISSIEKEQKAALEQRELYSMKSNEYAKANELLQEIDGRKRDKELELKAEEKRLSAYLEATRAYEAGVEYKSVKQLERVHNIAYKLFQASREKEEWELAMMSIALVVECIDSISKLEVDAASKLAASRKDQRSMAASLQKEVSDSKVAAEKAATDLAALQKQIESAKMRMSELEKREAREVSEAEAKYEEAVLVARKLTDSGPEPAPAPAPPPAPAPAPVPVPTPVPALVSRAIAPAEPAQPLEEVNDKGRPSFFSRGRRDGDAAPKQRPLPSIEQPFTPPEVDVTWALLVKGANIPNSDNLPIDFRLYKADFLRAVRNNDALTRLFGSAYAASRQYDTIDIDRDSSITKRELLTFLRFPSARRGLRDSSFNTRDRSRGGPNSVFDEIVAGTTRDED